MVMSNGGRITTLGPIGKQILDHNPPNPQPGGVGDPQLVWFPNTTPSLGEGVGEKPHIQIPAVYRGAVR